MTPITPAVLQNNIPVETAARYTANWRTAIPNIKLGAIGFINAFNIAKEDIDQLNMLIPHDGGCRAYFGISYDTNPATIKFLLVPVDAENRDITSIEDGNQSTVFDFTTPCPSQCASGHSPLLGT